MIDASELKRQYRISLVAFLSAGVLASLSTGYIYFTTRSLVFLLQFLLSLSGFVIHAIYLWISRTLYLKLSRELAHYHGKLESFASLIGVLIVYVNLIILFVLSAYRIMFPSDIAEMTIFSKITTAICITYNLILIIRCRVSLKNTGNIVMRAQLIEATKNLVTWLICAFTDIVATCFPEWVLSKYVEPVSCIILVFVVGYFYFGILKRCTLDLLDRSKVKLQADVLKILAGFDGVTAVSFRTCGKRIIVDASLRLSPDDTWGKAESISRDISDKVSANHPECHVHVKVDFE